MFVIPNSETPSLTSEEEGMFESVVQVISSELSESVVARGVTSIDYVTYSNANGDRIAFEFKTAGMPQVRLEEFQRVLAMRFVQILWERHGKRCLPVGIESKDEKFAPWPDGRPDYIVARQPTEAEAGVLPPGLENAVGRNDPCPCGSGKKYKNCCKR